jgi:hypothetical protein
MHRKLSLFAVLIFTNFLLLGCAGLQSGGAADTLVKLLTGQLGVTNDQAMGGVGSILSLGKERLSSMDFSTLTKFIPGADSFMKVAKSLGAVTGPVRNMTGLQSAFSKLGMGPEMIGKFAGVLNNSFKAAAGGDQAKSLLATVLK